MEAPSLTNRQRAVVNSGGIVAVRLALFVIGLLLVPFMIGRLGKEDYGVYQLVRSFIAYLPLLTLSAGPAVNRYVTHAITREDTAAIGRYMNTGLAIMGGFGALVLFAGCVLAYFLPSLVELREASRTAQWLLILLAATTAITYVAQGFQTPLFARERLAEMNLVSALADVVRAAGIIGAFVLIAAELEWVGIAALAGAVASLVVAIASTYWIFPWFRITLRDVDRGAGRDLVTFSGLTMLGGLAAASFQATDNFVIKWLYGPAGMAMITVYSVADTWRPWLMTLMQQLASIITPRMIVYSAQGRRESMRELTVIAIRYTTALVAPACVFMSVMAHPILSLWVGDRLTEEEIGTAAATLPIVLLPLILRQGTGPAGAVFVAEVKLLVPLIVSVVGAAVKILLSIYLARDLDLGLPGIAGGTAIVFVLRSTVFIPLYLRAIAGVSLRAFFLRGLAPPILLSAGFGALCLFSGRWISPESLLELAGMAGITGAAYVVGAWALVVTPEDRRRVMDQLRRVRGRS